MKKRVVVTGLGMLSPVGNSVEESWMAVCQSHSGIGKITKFDTNDLSVKIAGEVKNFDPLQFVSKSEARRLDDFILYATVASKMAMADANIIIDSERLGVVIGSAVGGLSTIEETHRTLIEKGYAKISPFAVPCSLANMASGFVSIQTQAKGPIGCMATACAAGSDAIANALMLIESGRADAVIAGGAEAAI
ncbi:MAG: beta-ketoacyl synthase N-terminal-like domain-containing protein, partial [Deltaproteobacteria bacterium]